MSINETVMEMHFHFPLIDLFRETLGLGNGAFNFYKYSPQRECFVGFDQAFVQTNLSEGELFRKLKDSAAKDGYSLSNFYVGYFLQFKIVKVLQKKMRHTPSQITSRPHYRISLDTQKNLTTGFSQHELLYNLNKNDGALVYYACPMLFDRTDLYNPHPDLDLLRLADVDDCPSIYDDNESHYIYFNDKEADPIWCSEPTEGRAYTPKHLFSSIKDKLSNEDFQKSQIRLLDALNGVEENVLTKKVEKLLNLVSDSLIIVSYTGEDASNKQEPADA